MAAITTITINGISTPGFNVCETVGNGCGNRKDNGDVLLVQTMLHLVAHHSDTTPSARNVGLTSMSELPELTGDFDAKTGHAILSYQRRHRLGLLSVDGVIHPGSYHNRNVRYGHPGDRLMTITLLHLQLLNSYVPAMQLGYTAYVLQKFPKLAGLLARC